MNVPYTQDKITINIYIIYALFPSSKRGILAYTHHHNWHNIILSYINVLGKLQFSMMSTLGNKKRQIDKNQHQKFYRKIGI